MKVRWILRYGGDPHTTEVLLLGDIPQVSACSVPPIVVIVITAHHLQLKIPGLIPLSWQLGAYKPFQAVKLVHQGRSLWTVECEVRMSSLFAVHTLGGRCAVPS